MPGHGDATKSSVLTRSQVARRIRRSIATVRRMEGRTLHPRLGPRGLRLFDPEEVEAEAARIEQTGRALEYASADSKLLSDRTELAGFRCTDGFTSMYRFARHEHQHRGALQRVAQLEATLAQTRKDHAHWKTAVEHACEALVAALGGADDDVLLAADELVAILRE